LDFALLVLLNAVLYVRPWELWPPLQPFHLFEVVILTCLVFGLPKFLPQLTLSSLAANPITACVLAFMGVTVLTDLVRFRLDTAWEAADELYKILVYYLLLVGVVDTPSRLHGLLRSVVVCGVFILALAVLQYHGLIYLSYLTVTIESAFVNGEWVEVRRLGTTSILGDPNDCALFINHCILVCLYLVTAGGGPRAARLLWLLSMGFFGYALALTQSRGGLVSLTAGLAAYVVGRFGRQAVYYGGVLIPVVLVFAFRGRQADISLGSGTGLQRVQLWAEYLGFFLSNPLLGVGWKLGPELVTLQAHNSYLQVYGEHGFFAGTFFVGAFYLAFRSFGRLLTPPGPARADPILVRVRPCLLALVFSQMAGMMALTRNFSLPTYTVLGLAAVYARLAGVDPPLPTGGRLARHLLTASVLFLVYMWLTIKFNLRYG